MIKKTVQILDTTLREGEQTPGVSFTHAQKIEIVKKLLSKKVFIKKIVVKKELVKKLSSKMYQKCVV